MNDERKTVKQQLDDELNEVQFTGHDQVIRQTHPPTLGARLSSLWNKEIEIPIKQVGAIAVIFVVTSLTLFQPHIGEAPLQNVQPVQQPKQRDLIEAGGNTYWKDVYEQAVKQYDN